MNPLVEQVLIEAVCRFTPDKVTVNLAELYRLGPYPNARRFLHHYLSGSATPIHIDIAQIFCDDPDLRDCVVDEITENLRKTPPPLHGSVAVPQEAWSQTQAAQDWRYAIGSLVMDWKVLYFDSSVKLGQMSPIRCPPPAPGRQARIELSFANKYQWHPEAKRITQCVHQAANNLKAEGAKDFWVYGDPYAISVPF
jgi:hypothetical protein